MQLHPIAQDGTVDLAGAESNAVLKDVVDATVALYGRVGFAPPWIGYVAVDDGRAVGSCGFAAPPSTDEAEVAYFTFPGHEGRGIATRMATALIALSLDAARTRRVEFIAHTLPFDSASTSILAKLGFQRLGAIQHPEDGEVWKWKRHDGDLTSLVRS
jgi:RimJ/RimL family protein N-acetyltransferase